MVLKMIFFIKNKETRMNSEKTKWSPIPGFPNYDISSDGKIRNNVTTRILHPSGRKDDRYQVTLYDEGRHKTFYVHKLVHDIFKGKPYSNCIVRHIDGDFKNNSAENLSALPRKGRTLKARLKQRRKVFNVTTHDIYESVTEAARSVNGTTQGLCTHLSKLTKTYKGQIFDYLS